MHATESPAAWSRFEAIGSAHVSSVCLPVQGFRPTEQQPDGGQAAFRLDASKSPRSLSEQLHRRIGSGAARDESNRLTTCRIWHPWAGRQPMRGIEV